MCDQRFDRRGVRGWGWGGDAVIYRHTYGGSHRYDSCFDTKYRCAGRYRCVVVGMEGVWGVAGIYRHTYGGSHRYDSCFDTKYGCGCAGRYRCVVVGVEGV